VIKLDREDVLYMLMMLDLSPDLRQILDAISSGGGEINDGCADDLRDLCNDQLDVKGYDKDYNLNDDGRKLESLADKLFIG